MTKDEHIRHLLQDPVYAIMGNEELCLGRSNLDVAKALLDAGVTIIQYREKHKKWRAKCAEATQIAQLCHEKNATFIMNDSVDLAIACGADGIHVGQDDAPVDFVRKMAGPDVFVGVSVNTIDEMRQALADGADYVGLGPMFPTQSKKDADEVVKEDVRKFALSYPLPVVTIGGISKENIRGLYDAGFRSFAMISALVGQQDIKQAVADIRRILK